MTVDRDLATLPMWDQPGVHDIYRRWRAVTDSYGRAGEDADRVLCAEAWVTPADALALYVRPDELHQSFNFAFLEPVDAAAMRTRSRRRSRAVGEVGAPQTWVLSNHDVVRHASRLGFRQVPGPLHRRDRPRRPAAGRRRSGCAGPAPRRR